MSALSLQFFVSIVIISPLSNEHHPAAKAWNWEHLFCFRCFQPINTAGQLCLQDVSLVCAVDSIPIVVIWGWLVTAYLELLTCFYTWAQQPGRFVMTQSDLSVPWSKPGVTSLTLRIKSIFLTLTYKALRYLLHPLFFLSPILILSLLWSHWLLQSLNLSEISAFETLYILYPLLG